MILFFDTETTGLPDWHAPSVSTHQPHIVQLAALLTDNEGHGKVAMNRIVKPKGWIVPDDVAAIHGITTERAQEEGIPIVEVLYEFVDLLRQAHLMVAYNLGFDARMLRIQMLRNRGKFAEWADALKKWPRYDPARSAKRHCQMAPTDKMMAAGYRTNKTPKLAEALQILCGIDLGDDAHEGAADVKALRRVFFALHRLEPITIPDQLPDAPGAPEEPQEGMEPSGPDDGIPDLATGISDDDSEAV